MLTLQQLNHNSFWIIYQNFSQTPLAWRKSRWRVWLPHSHLLDAASEMVSTKCSTLLAWRTKAYNTVLDGGGSRKDRICAKFVKLSTYSPDVERFESCRRTKRGDCGTVGGAFKSFLRLNMGDPTIALFWRVNGRLEVIEAPLDGLNTSLIAHKSKNTRRKC